MSINPTNPDPITNHTPHGEKEMSTDTDGIIDADDTKRFLLEVLENAGGLSKDELEKAYKQLVDLAVSAAMFSLWQAGDVTLSWNGPTQDLIWIHKDAAA